MNLLENNLKKRDFKNIYLLFGEENYFKSFYEKIFLETVFENDSFKMMNFDTLEGKAVSFEKIKEISETMPFMNDYRLLIIKESNLFFEGKKEDTKKLLEYIKNIPKTTIILFLEKNVDKKLKIFKELKNINCVYEFKKLGEDEMINFIVDFLAKYNKNMKKNTIIHFIKNVGYDLDIIINELKKLINYSKNKEIIIPDIENISTKCMEATIFDLVSEIGNKNLDNAIKIYKNLIFNKTSPFLILSMISRQFRILLQVKYLYQKNEPIYNIAKILNLREFIVRDAIKQINFFKIKTLINGIEDCLSTDNKIKTGILSDEIAIEMLIIKYCSI